MAELKNQNGDKRILVDQLYSVNSVADLLGVHRNTIYLLISDGRLEAFRIRSSLKVSRKSVLEYLECQRVSNEESS